MKRRYIHVNQLEHTIQYGPCPKCEAEAGTPCTIDEFGGSHVHAERIVTFGRRAR